MSEDDFIAPNRQVIVEIGDQLSVTPQDAVIKKGASIEWVIEGLGESQRLEINFHVKGGSSGPFAPQGTPANPHRGRYTSDAGPVIPTGESDQSGYWKYDIVVRTPECGDIALDPGIMIKEG
jgi:hypothetical protein